MNKLTIIFGFLILMTSYPRNIKSVSDKIIQPGTKSTNQLISKDLGYGFKITFGESEDFGNFKTYWDTKLYKDDAMTFADTDNEFEITDQYPSIRKIGEDFELLLLLNNRPDIKQLLMLKIHGNQVVLKELIPHFKMSPRDIDADGKPELVGIMSYYQMEGENGNRMPYVPILVYEYTDLGITLDSAETKNINILVYDHFYGFDYSEEYEFQGNERFENELNKYEF